MTMPHVMYTLTWHPDRHPSFQVGGYTYVRVATRDIPVLAEILFSAVYPPGTPFEGRKRRGLGPSFIRMRREVRELAREMQQCETGNTPST